MVAEAIRLGAGGGEDFAAKCSVVGGLLVSEASASQRPRALVRTDTNKEWERWKKKQDVWQLK
eukprot:8050856-Lingulodinium_polyedra.AAC.1